MILRHPYFWTWDQPLFILIVSIEVLYMDPIVSSLTLWTYLWYISQCLIQTVLRYHKASPTVYGTDAMLSTKPKFLRSFFTPLNSRTACPRLQLLKRGVAGDSWCARGCQRVLWDSGTRPLYVELPAKLARANWSSPRVTNPNQHHNWFHLHLQRSCSIPKPQEASRDKKWPVPVCPTSLILAIQQGKMKSDRAKLNMEKTSILLHVYTKLCTERVQSSSFKSVPTTFWKCLQIWSSP